MAIKTNLITPDEAAEYLSESIAQYTHHKWGENWQVSLSASRKRLIALIKQAKSVS